MKIKLSDISDISGTPPDDNDVLIWNALLGMYVPGPMAGGGGGPSSDVEPTATGPSGYLVESGAHKSWRLNCLTTKGWDSVMLSEIQFRSVVGVPELATGGVAFASSVLQGQVAANAFDNNTGTFWHTAGGGAGIIGYHFPQPVLVREVMMRIRGGYPTGAPGALNVDWSDDNGLTWTTEWHIPDSGMSNDVPQVYHANPNDPELKNYYPTHYKALNDVDWTVEPTDGQVMIWDDSEQKFKPGTIEGGSGGGGDSTFEVEPTATGPSGPTTNGPVAAKYWRVNCLTFGSEQYFSTRELQFRQEIGVAEQAVNGVPVVSGLYNESGNAAINAFDNNLNTMTIVQGGLPSWLGYNFSTPRAIRQVSITPRAAPYHYQAPTSFQIQRSDDGVTWVTEWSTSTTWPNDAAQTFNHPLANQDEVVVHHYPTTVVALNDVADTAPAHGQVLVWNSVSQRYEPGTVASGGGGGGSGEIGAHRYWAILGMVAAMDSANLQIGELKLRSTPGGPDLTGITATANSIYGAGFEAANLVDGNNGTKWAALGPSASVFFDLGTPAEVQEILIRSSLDNGNQAPIAGQVAFSDNGADWQTLTGFGWGGWNSFEDRLIRVPSTLVGAGGGGADAGPSPFWAEPPTPPVLAGFTSEISASTVFTAKQTSRGILAEVTLANSDRCAILKRPAPAGDWDIRMLISTPMYFQNYTNVSLYVRNTVTGRLSTFGIGTARIRAMNWSALGTYNSSVVEVSGDIAQSSPIWIRLRKVGTVLSWFISSDGESWFQCHGTATALETYVGGANINEFGFFCVGNGASFIGRTVPFHIMAFEIL
jgi:hypothetical protein